MSAEIIDLQSRSSDGVVNHIPEQIIAGLTRPTGEKDLPTMLLYDERGLRLYDDITTEAPEYYLFAAEEEILKNKSQDILHAMHVRSGGETLPGEAIVELGAGALRKTSHVLTGLSHLVETRQGSSPVTYYALDLEHRELERTLGDISNSDIGCQLEGKVITKGMWGTYDDGLKYIQNGGLETHKLSESLTASDQSIRFAAREGSPLSSDSSSTLSTMSSSTLECSTPATPSDDQLPPLHIMFLGSSLGNFSRTDAAAFLKSLPLRPGSGDTLLLGLDHDNDKKLIEKAYNDPEGYTKKFIFNGLKVAGRTLGDESMFDEDKWEYVNHYDVVERRHEAFFKSKVNQSISHGKGGKRVVFLKDELMKIEESLKFSDTDAYAMFAEANVRPMQRWTDSKSQYSLWLLERPPFSFPLVSSAVSSTFGLAKSSSSDGVPTRQEWTNLWTVWDFITLNMIPPSMLFQKPIDLRHICLFYLGHIPTFLDIHLSRLLKEPHTEPQDFKNIFERGIDPDVDDPNECHPHSEVPTDEGGWPKLETILQFRDDVRARLMTLYDDLESGRISLTRTIGRVLFMTLEHEAMHAETLLYMLLQRAGSGTIPPTGFTAPPWLSLKASWDASPLPPVPTVTLGPAVISLGHDDLEADDDLESNRFNVETHEFGWDNESPSRKVEVGQFKISWRPVTNGEFYDFYVSGGKNQVEFPASWVSEDGEIKVRTMYGPISMDVAQQWPVIVPFCSLSTYATVNGGRLPTEAELRLFYDKFESGYEGGANVGFRNWHPIPSTTGGERNSGKGTNGGIWEWTSTVFDKVDGFIPSKLYPGYSMDFFDGKHQVVIGGSYATVPRVASRRSFRNWYQYNYPYAWVGGRIVYDVKPEGN